MRASPARTCIAWALVAGLVTGLAAGCGGGGSGPPGDPTVGLVGLVVTPSSATVPLVPGAPPGQASFHAEGAYLDGTTRDVTAAATWAVDTPGLGSITAGTFSSGARGGQTLVRATLGARAATATVKVIVQATIVAPGAPASAPALFAGAVLDPSLAPVIDYPYDGVLVPPNLRGLDVQWRPPSAAEDLYRLTVTGPFIRIAVYTTSPFCAFDATLWDAVSQTSEGGSVVLTASGLASAVPGSFGASAPVRALFSDGDLAGAIYYWSTDPANEGVFRYAFGARGKGTPYYGMTTAGGHCVGCHALSRDGTQLAINYCGAMSCETFNSFGGLLAVGTGAALFDWSAAIPWSFSTFFPDGSKLVTSWSGQLTVRQADSTGTAIATVPVPAGALGATHPDVSPDATHLAYAFAPGGGCATFGPLDFYSTGDGLAVVPLAGTTFGAPVVVVPPDPTCAANRFYPSFSPDGRWLLYTQSSGDTYDDPDSRLYLVPAAGGSPVALANASNFGPVNSWPRWCPFSSSFAGRPIGWMTFSSKRDYGDAITGGVRSQIWMAAVTPGDASRPDPSYPPFWLPFQDSSTSNHIAQWTTELIP